MAKKRGKNSAGIIFTIVGAAIVGGFIGVVFFNDPGTPLPAAPEVEFVEEYDDSWGRRPTAIARCVVTHVLVKVDENRTDEEAKKKIEQLWALYRNNPNQGMWKDIQAKNNEDGQPHTEYPIPGSYMPEFLECGKMTKEGFARICKTSYGYHLIRTKHEDDK